VYLDDFRVNSLLETRTLLEDWRFAHLATYKNSGTAADEFDADFHLGRNRTSAGNVAIPQSAGRISLNNFSDSR